MKHKQKGSAVIAIIMAVTIASAITSIGTKASAVQYTFKEPQKELPKLSHQQDTWKRALEWCESSGYTDAVNKEDLDGTPSFGSWQFKPSTLDYFAKKYSIATTTVMDREVQDVVLTQMILHRNEIDWNKQFPWCVKKLGLPPLR